MRVKDEWAGKKARCPGCNQILTITPPSRIPSMELDDVIDAEIVEEKPTSIRRAAERANPRPVPKKPAELDEDDEVIEAEPIEQKRSPVDRGSPGPSAKKRSPRDEDDEVIEAEPVDEKRSAIRQSPKRRDEEDEEDERPLRARSRRDEDEEDDRPRRRHRDEDDEDDRPRSRRVKERLPPRMDDAKPMRRRRRDEYQGSSRFGTVNAGMVGGMLMMILAVVWFVGGLAVGYIFFYPPILLVLGIIAFAKGCMGE
jgi:hypothetical protein